MPTKNKFLNEASKMLIKTFGSPGEMLLFINELSYSASTSEIKKPNAKPDDKGAFFIKLLIEEILTPWINAGKNDVAIICNGLYKIYDCIGPHGYHQDISKLIACFYMDSAEAPNFEQTQKKYRKYYTCLFDIYYCLVSCGEDHGQ